MGPSSEKAISGLIVIMLPLIMLCQLLCSWVQVRHPKVSHFIPEVGIIILVGLAGSAMIKGIEGLGGNSQVFKDIETFSPSLFFVGLLPPIIFNSGFHLKRHFFFVNLPSILAFSIIGTVLSAAMVSAGLYYLNKAGLLGPGPRGCLEGLSWAEACTFGALISATDPVSTLVLFADLRVEPNLFYLVFGESVLNDAVGLVLFDTASDFITEDVSDRALADATGTFVLNLVGSLVAGLLLSLFMAAIIKRSELHHNFVLEQGLVVLFVYMPYVVGELCSLSGIVTTLTAGMASRKFLYPNLTVQSQELLVGVLRMLSGFAETAAFLDLGLTCIIDNSKFYNPRLMAWAVLLCSVSRPIQVYLLSTVLNASPMANKIDGKTQAMLSFAGLRGVVAFACMTMWPDTDEMGHDARERRKVFLATTTSVILFTVFVQGGLTPLMLDWLKIQVNVDEDALPMGDYKKPKFMRAAIAFVDAWVAPLALSPQQMAEVRQARLSRRTSSKGSHQDPLLPSNNSSGIRSEAEHSTVSTRSKVTFNSEVVVRPSASVASRLPRMGSVGADASIYDFGFNTPAHPLVRSKSVPVYGLRAAYEPPFTEGEDALTPEENPGTGEVAMGDAGSVGSGGDAPMFEKNRF